MRYKPIEKELFHVHTYRCGHAGNEKEQEYIEAAISLGATRIVFTDHAPFPGDPFGNRMDYEQLPEYIGTMQSLKTRYSGQIEILCGLEIEFLPSFIEYYKQLKENDGIDLLVLGQHFYEHEPGQYSFSDSDKEYAFEGQCEAIAQGIETGLFDVIAHPDRSFRASNSFGDREVCSANRIINALNNVYYKPYLERNVASKKNRKYYKEEFWEQLCNGIVPGIVIGIDAHSINQLIDGWNYIWHFDMQPFTKLYGSKRKLAVEQILCRDKETKKSILSINDCHLKEKYEHEKLIPMRSLTAHQYLAICRCVYDALDEFPSELQNDELYCLYRMYTEDDISIGIPKVKNYESEEEMEYVINNWCIYGYHMEEIVSGRITLDIEQTSEGYLFWINAKREMKDDDSRRRLVHIYNNCREKGYPVKMYFDFDIEALVNC